MAGVKTKSAGKRIETAWTPRTCDECGQPIDLLKNAARIKGISYEPRRVRYTWRHRTHIGGAK